MTTDKILEKIKNENLRPVAKWHFVVKKIGGWLLVAIATILGGGAFSTIIFTIANQDWDIANNLGTRTGQLFFMVFPYFWLIILAILLMLAYFEFRHTKRGYKYSLILVAGLYIIITGLLGGIFYRLGWAAQLEQAAAGNLPYYNQMIYARGIWVRPEAGLLAGKIISANGNIIKIWDLNGQEWTVDVSSSSQRALINSEKDIKIIGEQTGDRQFQAWQIRPWCGCSGCMHHRGQSCLDHCRARPTQ